MALGSATTTTAAAFLKTIYKEDYQQVLYKNSPFFGLVKKINDFTGDGTMQFTVQYSGGQGVAGDFTNAQSNQSTTLSKRFALTRSSLYGTGKIDGNLIRASKNDNGALARMLKQEQEGLTYQLKRQISNLLYGNAGGAFGQVGAISTNTITLADPTQVVWFDVDQRINLATTDGTSGSLETGTMQITHVNRRTGVLTFAANVTATIATAAVNDYLFIAGNFGQTNTMLMGLNGWIPLSDPTATTFFGVDRSVDTARLGGLRYLANAGGAIEETLINACAYFQQEGAEPDTLLMNPVDVQKLVTALAAKSVIVTPFSRNASSSGGDGSTPEVGYSAFHLVTPMGKIEVFADHGCPVNRAYVLQLDTWELHTMGDFPMFIEEDGMMLLRSATADTFEWRMLAAGNLACKAPGKNGVVQLA